jgi:Tol biopolymer transport system component
MTWGGLAWATAVLSVSLTAAGCGGGGGTGAGRPVGVQTETIGQAKISFTGSPKAVTTSSSGSISAVGQAGADYSYLALFPTPNLASTYLAFSRAATNGDGNSQVYTLPFKGAPSPRVIFPSELWNLYPTCSQTGIIAFDSGKALAESFMQFCLPDGTSYRYLKVGGGGNIPAISPDGSTIIYVSGTNALYSIPSVGGTQKNLYTAPSGSTLAQFPVVWSPDGTEIAFSLYTGSTAKLFVLTLATGNVVGVTPDGNAGTQLVPNSWSSDGRTLACTDYHLANVVLVNLNSNQFAEITPTSAIDSNPTFSPDGQQIAFYRSGNSYAHGIYVCDFNGENPQLLLADPSSGGSTGPVSGLVWSPFPQKKVFVGSGGWLSSSASGFLLSQNGSQFGSLLAFTAKTPSTAAITPPAGVQAGAPLLYTLTADSITSISYTNSYYGSAPGITAVGITSVVVSVDGSTGQIDLVAPAKLMKGSASKVPNAGMTYSGQFTALYDGAGKNLAPSGATSIQIDPRTGKLISFR